MLARPKSSVGGDAAAAPASRSPGTEDLSQLPSGLVTILQGIDSRELTVEDATMVIARVLANTKKQGVDQLKALMLSITPKFEELEGFVREEERKNEVRVLLVGVQGVGKTTALYEMKLGEIVTTIPTIGFNVEVISFGGKSFTVWDVGGQEKIRPLWRHYYQNTQLLLFMLDASSDDVMESREALQPILREDELRGVPIAIIANKMNQAGARTLEQLIELYELNKIRDRHWKIFGTHSGLGGPAEQKARKEAWCTGLELLLAPHLPIHGVQRLVAGYGEPPTGGHFQPLEWFINEVHGKPPPKPAPGDAKQDGSAAGSDALAEEERLAPAQSRAVDNLQYVLGPDVKRDTIIKTLQSTNWDENSAAQLLQYFRDVTSQLDVCD